MFNKNFLLVCWRWSAHLQWQNTPAHREESELNLVPSLNSKSLNKIEDHTVFITMKNGECLALRFTALTWHWATIHNVKCSLTCTAAFAYSCSTLLSSQQGLKWQQPHTDLNYHKNQRKIHATNQLQFSVKHQCGTSDLKNNSCY